MKTFKHLIIGAGPTGLGAAYRLKELGQEFHVLEAASTAGGLASSFVDAKGFTWDIGGHVQFSHYKYFDELMRRALGGEGWLHHQRESWAWMEGRFVPYPVQNNIRYLTRETMLACLEGLVVANQSIGRDRPANFKEWIAATFGEGLAKVFMNPYNYKVWAFPPETMSYGWIGERVAVTDLRRVLRNVVLEQDDLSWGPNNTFGFPKEGGTGAIWRSVAGIVGASHFTYGARVTRIDTQSRSVEMSSGECFGYERLLSTMPLDVLCRLVSPGLPEGILAAANKLRYSTSHIVGLGLQGTVPEALRTKCWMYFPESDCPFYRATVFSNYSPKNVPDPRKHWSLMTETSESPQKPLDRERLVEHTIEGALKTKLVRSRSDIASVWTYTAEHGYPTPSLERDSALTTILPALDRMDIYSRGRFGAWKYEVANQDHSVMQGVEWANRVALGIPELTMPFPGTANANWGR